ncbi:MAG TPA: damage-inducible protein D [Bacteroidia bacterium]|nr:damage-inducible protein D [Bacteroidia bacterium]
MKAEVVLRDDFLFDDLQDLVESEMPRYASEAATGMHFSDPRLMADAVGRAGNVCASLGLPLRNHFKRVYRCDHTGVYTDWKLSDLAFRLVCLNGDCCSTQVANLQMLMLQQLRGEEK